MPERREVLGLLGVGAVAGIAGWWGSSHREAATPILSDGATSRFVDLEGKARSLAEWDGRVRVLNFWATWCAPCREEIPALVLSRNKLLPSGVEFIGIAIDQVAKVVEFVRSVPISYPVLVAGAPALELVRQLGNPSGGLPFTVVLNAQGAVAHRNLGAVTQEKIEAQVRGVLAG